MDLTCCIRMLHVGWIFEKPSKPTPPNMTIHKSIIILQAMYFMC